MLRNAAVGLTFLCLLPLSGTARAEIEYDIYPLRASVSFLFEQDSRILAATLEDDEILRFMFETTFGESVPESEFDEIFPGTGLGLAYGGEYSLIVILIQFESDELLAFPVAIIEPDSEIVLSNEQDEDDFSFTEVGIRRLELGLEGCLPFIAGQVAGLNSNFLRFLPGEEERVPYTTDGVLRTGMSGFLGEAAVLAFEGETAFEALVVGGSISAILHPRRAVQAELLPACF